MHKLKPVTTKAFLLRLLVEPVNDGHECFYRMLMRIDKELLIWTHRLKPCHKSNVKTKNRQHKTIVGTKTSFKMLNGTKW